MPEKKLTTIHIFPSQKKYEQQKNNIKDSELAVIPVDTDLLRGRAGKDGAKGAKGDAGKNGIDGKGVYELAVEQGFQGSKADFLASLKGEKGEKGDDGGKNGKDGLSAYEIAVKLGFTGSEEAWLASLKGDKGDKGDTGEKGDKGDTGSGGSSSLDITPLNNNDDLNNYKSTGFYICKKYATAQTLKNLPNGFKTAFFMLVLNNDLILQLLWHYEGAQMFIRSNDYYDNTDHWSKWYRFNGTQIS